MALYPGHKVTAIIPARNEARNLTEVIEGVKPFVDEVLMVDGNSTDGSRELATSLGARVVLDRGKGKGDAVRVGIDTVDGDIIVLIDADCSHDPKDIPALLEPIIAGRADMVIGSRMTGGSHELHGDINRFIRVTGSHIILLAINYRWNVRLTDVQNGFRAIRTDAARAIGLRENIHTIEEEMVMKALKKGYRVTDVPSREYERKHGHSTLSHWKDGHRFVWCVLKNIF
jgi:dolichol-phosphate mannosyltransferase